MSQDKEREIRRQFLDEAQEYLDALDAAVMGLSSDRVDLQKINAALRAAHSIKGGAGMMGFELLSSLSHRLEDSFKVLKTQHHSVQVDGSLENLLLAGVQTLRQVIQLHQQDQAAAAHWVEQEVESIFAQLHDRLGDPPNEDAASVLATDNGSDIIPLLFETEVEGSLQRLEAILRQPNQPDLGQELLMLTQELSGLGEMLDIPAFCQLCESVTQAVEGAPTAIAEIAEVALKQWRRSQSLVLIGQLDLLPTAIEGDFSAIASPFPATANLETSSPEWQVAFNEHETWYSTATDIPELSPSNIFDSDLLNPDFLNSDLLNPDPLDPDLLNSDQLNPDLLDPDRLTSELSDSDIPTPNHHFPVEAASVHVPSTWVTEHTWEAADYEPAAYTQVSLEDSSENSGTDFKVVEAPSETSGPSVEDQHATVRVSVRQLNQLNDLFGELTIQRNGLDLYLKRMRGLIRLLVQRARLLEQSNSQLRTAYDRVIPHSQNSRLPLLAPASNSSIQHHSPHSTPIASFSIPPSSPSFDALEMDQYTELHLLSQQVMETIVQVQEVSSDIDLSLDDTEQATRELNKNAKQLQTSLTQIRMRPLGDVVDRFPRSLRELCLQHGKQARLEIIGSHTLIERSILEALNDPLMHLLRNAFDHGIESPDNRIAQNKPAEGVIEISASHRGNRTIITMSDDGSGIPLEKIRTKATQMGLDASLLATASDADLLSLIFEPGFSTSDQVTSLSGRGVGLDVVRDSLRQIRGEISVETKAGKGTTFTLSVPFTLSVVQVLIVESNGMLIAVPTDMIRETVLLANMALSPHGSLLTWQGNSIKVIRPAEWLQFNCFRQPQSLETVPSIDAPTVLIVNQGNQPVALQVDRCWGEQEVTIRRVEGNLRMPDGFTGCAIVADGRIVPLVNVSDLLNWIVGCERTRDRVQPVPLALPASLLPRSRQSTFPPAALSPSITQPLTILIVDDSINIRRFLALTLERAGFRVEQAKDGQDALEKVQQGLSFQAVICDIEMPRLDGYGFLSKFKANPSFEHIPVAMLTSRSGDKHRQLALNLGASAYLSKPYNEQVLLQTLEELLNADPVHC